jgi:hypothetical protein
VIKITKNVRIVDIPAEIQSGHFPNANQERYYVRQSFSRTNKKKLETKTCKREKVAKKRNQNKTKGWRRRIAQLLCPAQETSNQCVGSLKQMSIVVVT